MESDQLSTTAVRFLHGHIASEQELELLVALVESPSRWWDAGAVSREFRMSRRVASATLDRFAAANLLEIRVTDDVRYQFRPGTAELGKGAVALTAAYRADPAGVVRGLVVAGGRSRQN